MELEEARDALLMKICCTSEMVRVHLTNALGRILAADIRAPFSVPSFPKSAMDGYAVWSEDVQSATKDNPVRLRVVGECLAGETYDILRRILYICYTSLLLYITWEYKTGVVSRRDMRYNG